MIAIAPNSGKLRLLRLLNLVLNVLHFVFRIRGELLFTEPRQCDDARARVFVDITSQSLENGRAAPLYFELAILKLI